MPRISVDVTEEVGAALQRQASSLLIPRPRLCRIILAAVAQSPQAISVRLDVSKALTRGAGREGKGGNGLPVIDAFDLAQTYRVDRTQDQDSTPAVVTGG
jgi:hypothetical protein